MPRTGSTITEHHPGTASRCAESGGAHCRQREPRLVTASSRTLSASRPTEPIALIESTHQALTRSRGAAVAVARVHQEQSLLKYSGVGNISGTLLDGAASRGLVSHNGTAGHLVPRVQQFDYACGERDVLVMHSDGLTSRWTLEQYPGLQAHHPSVIAGVLYRDFTRGRDDVTVVVVKRIQKRAS